MVIIIRFFRYIYFRIYTWDLKNWGKGNNPEFNAMLGISFLMFINLYTFLEAYFILSKAKLPAIQDMSSKLIIAMLMICIGVINFFFFVNNKQYELIANEFKSQIKHERKKGTIIIFLYIFLSFAVPITLAIVYRIYHI